MWERWRYCSLDDPRGKWQELWRNGHGKEKLEMSDFKNKILLIDEDEKEVKFLLSTLEDEGLEVLTVSGGKQGLDAVRREMPDIVILGTSLHGISQLECITRIRNIDRQIKVIIVAKMGALEVLKVAMRLGAYDYITRPFDASILRSVIASAVAGPSGGRHSKTKPEHDIDEIERYFDELGHCCMGRACLWETALRAFISGDYEFVSSWMLDESVSGSERKALMEFTHLLKREMEARSK